jgi:hypothetical protein
MSRPYNPLDKANLGKSVADALLNSEVVALSTLERFQGAGVYALYYVGDFPVYAPITARNRDGLFDLPIYVGSAVPPGGRRGKGGLTSPKNTKLYTRLSKHRQSIELAENLETEDFHCRFLLVDEVWIPLGESLLIAKFSPLWNHKLDGFGNHDPGKNRTPLRSRWDTVHFGRDREWKAICQNRPETKAQLINDIESYLRTI